MKIVIHIQAGKFLQPNDYPVYLQQGIPSLYYPVMVLQFVSSNVLLIVQNPLLPLLVSYMANLGMSCQKSFGIQYLNVFLLQVVLLQLPSSSMLEVETLVLPPDNRGASCRSSGIS